MVLKQAWEDRDRFIKLFKSLSGWVDYFNQHFEELKAFKNEVLNNVDRKNEMKKLIDEDPDWTLTKIQGKYDEFKAIYDYLNQ